MTDTPTAKVCSVCKIEKSIIDFYRNKRVADGFMFECKACHEFYRHTWRRNNPHKYQNQVLKRLYGITGQEYEVLLLKQGYSCAICKKHVLELSRKLDVDHDHETGRIRGLLCGNCNTALGLLRDNVNLLYVAIDYLDKSMEKVNDI